MTDETPQSLFNVKHICISKLHVCATVCSFMECLASCFSRPRQHRCIIDANTHTSFLFLPWNPLMQSQHIFLIRELDHMPINLHQKKTTRKWSHEEKKRENLNPAHGSDFIYKMFCKIPFQMLAESRSACGLEVIWPRSLTINNNMTIQMDHKHFTITPFPLKN